MTKIFRSSFYRLKQPGEEEEKGSAAGEYEYVDLQDGQGGKHAGGGGVDSDGPLVSDVVLTTVIGISFMLLGCFYLFCPCGLQPGAAGPEGAVVVITGVLFLALGAAAFARLALLRGYACTSWWRTSPASG